MNVDIMAVSYTHLDVYKRQEQEKENLLRTGHAKTVIVDYPNMF